MSAKKGRIVGIKAIADYLDISERNVYRWEHELGLPLQRVAGSKGRYVYVDVEDLENWLKKRKSSLLNLKKHSKKIAMRVTLFLIIFLVVATLFILFRTHNERSDIASNKTSRDFPNPISASIDGKIVYIKGNKGQRLWYFCGHEEDMDTDVLNKAKIVNFFDLDNDNANEVIARIYNREEDKFYLILFDNDGTELWRRDITNKQEFNGIKFESDFFPMQIRLAHLQNGESRIITYWRHSVRFLSLISSHTPDGDLLNEYVHTGNLGTLDTFDLDKDGNDDIIFAGTNNLLNGEGIVGVLCSTDFKGVSPPYRVEPEYNDLGYWLKSYVPDSPEHGNQNVYIRFKKTKHLSEYLRTYVFAFIDNTENGLVHVLLTPWNLEFESKAFGFEYVFDSEFNLRDVIPDGPMLKFYPILKKDREIGISLKELTKVYSENILRWKNGNWFPVSE